MFLVITSCNVAKEKLFIRENLKNNYKQSDNNINNIETKNCAWLYLGKQLSKYQIDSLKNLIYKKQTNVEVRTISSDTDSLQKYKIKETCLVILQ